MEESGRFHKAGDSLGMVDEYNLALQKWSLQGTHVQRSMVTAHPVYSMVVKNMDSRARVQVLALPFKSEIPRACSLTFWVSVSSL